MYIYLAGEAVQIFGCEVWAWQRCTKMGKGGMRVLFLLLSVCEDYSQFFVWGLLYIGVWVELCAVWMKLCTCRVGPAVVHLPAKWDCVLAHFLSMRIFRVKRAGRNVDGCMSLVKAVFITPFLKTLFMPFHFWISVSWILKPLKFIPYW
jgi:hypothetical protein